MIPNSFATGKSHPETFPTLDEIEAGIERLGDSVRQARGSGVELARVCIGYEASRRSRMSTGGVNPDVQAASIACLLYM